MKTIVAFTLAAMFTWAWASKEEPENMTLGACYQGEGEVWICR